MTARAPFNGIIERVEAPEGATFEEDAFGGISGWWVKPAETREGSAILRLRRLVQLGNSPGILQPGGPHRPESWSSGTHTYPETHHQRKAPISS